VGAAAVPLAIAAGGQLLNALGNKQGGQTGVAVPPDLQGARSSQIGLLQGLLPNQGQLGQGNALQNISQAFGPLGVPQTDLQRQSAGNLTNMLNANAPGSAQNVLQGMLTGTGPQFERDIANANQQGARFGSANEILRGEALRNLFNMRTQTAQTLQALNQGGFGIGAAQAAQGDIGLQRLLNLFGGLLGQRQQATMELPITQTPNTAQAAGGALGNIGMLLPFLQGLGGGGGGATGGTGNPDAFFGMSPGASQGYGGFQGFGFVP
jgi:hypothetical protein